MEFACSHVVCDWSPDIKGSFLNKRHPDKKNETETEDAPPLPPRHPRRPRPTSFPLPPLPPQKPLADHQSLPPPVPPRLDKLEAETRLEANVNIVSLKVEKLIDTSRASETSQNPVVCGKCGAALSLLSRIEGSMWVCEFCGRENMVDDGVSGMFPSRGVGGRCDDLYLPVTSEDDYQNLEDTLVVFCVDISGSMSVTTEVLSDCGSTTHVSRLEGVQDALQGALLSMVQRFPRRRVALVTFNDEVVLYGDGTRAPATLRDWALVDYDHVWHQAEEYKVPHCVAETINHLTQRVKELREHGATALGPAVLASVAMASRYPGSKVILCTDGKANIGLGEMEQTVSSSSPLTSYFYRELGLEAVRRGVIISVMTFKGIDCRLADVGRLADVTGGRVNIVSPGSVRTNIQSVCEDEVLATGVMATVLAPDGVFFPYEDKSNHKLAMVIGNVTKGMEISFQFAVKPEFEEVFLQRKTLPFQLQLNFRSRDQQKVTRIITEQRPVSVSSRIPAGKLNVAVLSVHCAQLCAALTMEGRVQEAQKQLRTQQELLRLVSKLKPNQKEESIYGHWMETMTTICDDINVECQVLSDEAAEVMYHMRRASSKTAQTQKPHAEGF